MAIDKEKLLEIISGNARTLCSPNGDRIIEQARIDAKNGIKRESKQGSFNVNTVKNSKLPDFIKESMINNPITTDPLDILDEVADKISSKNPIQEVKQSYAISNGVDYTIIKAIVNECLKEYFEKQPINESASLKTIGLQNGNINLIDNKGNIFRAKLEKIGNKNDKK